MQIYARVRFAPYLTICRIRANLSELSPRIPSIPFDPVCPLCVRPSVPESRGAAAPMGLWYGGHRRSLVWQPWDWSGESRGSHPPALIKFLVWRFLVWRPRDWIGRGRGSHVTGLSRFLVWTVRIPGDPTPGCLRCGAPGIRKWRYSPPSTAAFFSDFLACHASNRALIPSTSASSKL